MLVRASEVFFTACSHCFMPEAEKSRADSDRIVNQNEFMTQTKSGAAAISEQASSSGSARSLGGDTQLHCGRAAYVPRYGFIWIWSRRKINFLCGALPLHKNRKALTSPFLGSGSQPRNSLRVAHT
jgi:hypothetical protein